MGAGYFVSRLRWSHAADDYDWLRGVANELLAGIDLGELPATHEELVANHDQINQGFLEELSRRRASIGGDALSLPLYGMGWMSWHVAIMAAAGKDAAGGTDQDIAFLRACLDDLGVKENLVDGLVESARRLEKAADGSLRAADVGSVASDWMSEVMNAWIELLGRLDPEEGPLVALSKQLAGIEALVKKTVPSDEVREWQDDQAARHFETKYRNMFKSRDRRVFEQVIGVIGKRVAGEIDAELTKDLKKLFGLSA
jgi:hypothetical protein